MPNINDIMSVANALEKSPVLVVKDRCSALRNRNSTCRKCSQACPHHAIEVSPSDIELNASLCVGCGVCTVLCPNEALTFTGPSDAQLAEQTWNAAVACGGTVIIACARIASKRIADPEKYAEVPCLGRLEESLLVHMVSRGMNEVVLVDGDCSTCKHRDCIPYIDDTIAFTNQIIEVQGGNVLVRRQTGFPEGIEAINEKESLGASRRSFFSEAAEAAKDTAFTAAKSTIEQELGLDFDKLDNGGKPRVTENGTLALLEMPRRDVLINAMDAIGEPVEEVLITRRFASIDIDTSICNACGMCETFCPTGAITRINSTKFKNLLVALEFSACECVQCGMCADVCWKHALKLNDAVPTEELFSFEPRVFQLR